MRHQQERYADRRGGSGRRNSSGRRNQHRTPGMGAGVPAGIGIEPMEISGGQVVFIDQFMVENRQFRGELREFRVAGQSRENINQLIADYGGAVVDLEPGRYSVARDPLRRVISVFSSNGSSDHRDSPDDSMHGEQVINDLLENKDSLKQAGRVFVDTRCLVCIDLELIEDQNLMSRFAMLRRRGNDKPARDLLREHGAAVRYGFDRYGDQLKVLVEPSTGQVLLTA